ncbi:hypothetical protein BG61_08610 [Caballeronia glathei]|uniref:Uncharacterized protein n=1 Tax=Caballeronia glathei TaxID=60547 RepID=A0A069PAQ0_9BURK|nr:hypothetical protein BG61_08610 [Caballeronia glathei]
METSDATNSASDRKYAFTHITKRPAALFDCVLTDAATDIELAARNLQISDASFVRLRRVMDRVACAQRLLETIRVASVGTSGVRAKGDETGMRQMVMRDAVELLARGATRLPSTGGRVACVGICSGRQDVTSAFRGQPF